MIRFLPFTYFYHINEGKRERKNGRSRLFHHRFFWDFAKIKGFNLEVASGPDFSFQFQRGEAGDNENACQITLGLLFFTIFFTFPVSERFLEKKKCIATWDNDREFWLVQGRHYGFYFYEWAFVWSWHAKVHESGSADPWWMHRYWHIDEWFLGKWECLESNIGPELQNIYFKIGNKEFKIDSVKWSRRQRFRRFVPFSMYHKTWISYELDCKSPPMRSGKGENNWDCGDDGTFGVSGPWKGIEPRWDKRDELAREVVTQYVRGVLRDAKRYGGADGDRGISANDQYEFIGFK